jgi:hypothetical protein
VKTFVIVYLNVARASVIIVQELVKNVLKEVIIKKKKMMKTILLIMMKKGQK